MKGGWFVGNFEPTLYKTNDTEVAVKEYKAGDYGERHYHKIATELTVIVRGIVKMNDIEYPEGSIIVMEPEEKTDFYLLLSGNVKDNSSFSQAVRFLSQTYTLSADQSSGALSSTGPLL